MKKFKKQQPIKDEEINLENYNKKNIKNVFSINYFQSINYSPRLLPLKQEFRGILPNINRFLNINDSDEGEEGEEQEEVVVKKGIKEEKERKKVKKIEKVEEVNDVLRPRMLFIPLKSAKQISLSQSSSGTESNQSFHIQETTYPITNLTKYTRKRKLARQPLSTLTNQTSSTTSSSTTTTTTRKGIISKSFKDDI